MKFGKKLQQTLTPEWLHKYLNYEYLKTQIENFKNEFDDKTIDREVYNNAKDKFTNTFLKKIDDEFTKCDEFYQNQDAANMHLWKDIQDRWFDLENKRRELNKKQILKEMRKIHSGTRSQSIESHLKRRPNISLGNEDDDFVRAPNLYYKTSKTSQKIKNFLVTKIAPKISYNYFNAKFKKTQELSEYKNSLSKFEMLIQDFYMQLIYLIRFQENNKEGFRKILKKFDKNLKSDQGSEKFQSFVKDKYKFFNDKNTVKLSEAIEKMQIDIDEGDIEKAREKIRVPEVNRGEINPFLVSVIGFLSGILICLGSIIVYRFGETEKTIKNQENFNFNGTMNSTEIAQEYDDFNQMAWTVFRIYRPAFYLVFYSFFIACNIAAFRMTGVNYVLIFELDSRHHLKIENLFIMSLICTIVLAVCFYVEVFLIPKTAILPLMMYGSFVFYLINPLPILQFESRYWLLKKIGRAFSFGLMEVRFTDFWLADQFNSLASFFVDFASSMCILSDSLVAKNDLNPIQPRYYIPLEVVDVDSEDFSQSVEHCKNFSVEFFCIAFIPPLMRFCQCVRRYYDTSDFYPHMWNAGKYCCGMLNVITGILMLKYPNQPWSLVLYIFSHILASVATMLWDYIKDWGFLTNTNKHKILGCISLRDELVLFNPFNDRSKTHYFYYFAIFQNFIIRWSWIISIFCKKYNILNTLGKQMILGSILTLAEIARRGFWNFIRLENEHLNNCGDFRVMRRVGCTKKY